MKQIKRGQIWFVRLDPAEGTEPRKIRPSLVLQNDIGNQYSETFFSCGKLSFYR